MSAKPSEHTKIMNIEVVVQQMPGKTYGGKPAVQAFRKGQPKTWEAGWCVCAYLRWRNQ